MNHLLIGKPCGHLWTQKPADGREATVMVADFMICPICLNKIMEGVRMKFEAMK